MQPSSSSVCARLIFLAFVSLSFPAHSDDYNMDINAYCVRHGQRNAVSTNSTAQGWRCAPSNTHIDGNQLCREQYGVGFVARLSSGRPYGWACHDNQQSALPAPTPIPAPSPPYSGPALFAPVDKIDLFGRPVHATFSVEPESNVLLETDHYGDGSTSVDYPKIRVQFCYPASGVDDEVNVAIEDRNSSKTEPIVWRRMRQRDPNYRVGQSPAAKQVAFYRIKRGACQTVALEESYAGYGDVTISGHGATYNNSLLNEGDKIDLY